MNHLGDTNKMVGEDVSNEQMTAHATPNEELQRQILSHVVPKNEREWWAARAIERLEFELNAANNRIKRLEKDSERLQWLLDRGLAWRDCYDEHWIEGEWLYASQDAIETIDKAKEAKP